VLLFVALAGPVGADSLEDGVLAEINYARTHPVAYAHLLRRQAGGPNDPADNTFSPPYEDSEATDEAYAFLMRQQPLPPLRSDRRLAAAAAEHSNRQGPTGRVGHADQSGETLLERFQHHGLWASMNSEDISYGYANPHNVVVQLIVDSGIPDRGHRQIIFDPTLQAAGVGCGRHAVYGELCVIDFAGGILDR
jgi:uncharacterized protein YkwD